MSIALCTESVQVYPPTPQQWAYMTQFSEEWIRKEQQYVAREQAHLESEAEKDERIEELLREVAHYKSLSKYYADTVEWRRKEERYQRNLDAHEYLHGNVKTTLRAIRQSLLDKKLNPCEFSRVDLGDIAQKTGVTPGTISKHLEQLIDWGAFVRTDEYEEAIKKGRQVDVDHIFLAMTEAAAQSPLNVKPTEEHPEHQWGGHREYCKKCGSQNTRRIYHVQCLECGHEDVRYPLTDEQKQMFNDLDEALQEPELPELPQLVAPESHTHQETDMPISDEELTEELNEIISQEERQEMANEEVEPTEKDVRTNRSILPVIDTVPTPTRLIFTCSLCHQELKPVNYGSVICVECPDCDQLDE